MQAITLEVILRAVFGTRDERLRVLLRDLLATTTSMGLQVSVMFGRRKPLEQLQETAKDIDGCCSPRSRSGGARRAKTSARCSSPRASTTRRSATS